MAKNTNTSSHQIDASRIAFLDAWEVYRKRNGVSTAAFWRLGVKTLSDSESEELRGELFESLLNEKFTAAHVPGFFLLIQTRATEHSQFLWERTVIPLLAGVGDDQQSRIDALRPAFENSAQNSVLHDALRKWLRKYERDLPYNPGSHSWFVNAVIGECALVRISARFATEYLDEMFARGALGDIVVETAESQFDIFLERCLRIGTLQSNEEKSVRALKDCLVEAAIRIAKISRLIRNQTPPVNGWTVDEIIDLSRRVLATDLSGLPQSAVNVLRERIGVGIATLTFDQVVRMFKEHPHAKLFIHGDLWHPSCELGLPIASASLQIGEHTRRVQLVDDLGRGPNELASELRKGDTGWQEAGNISWRVAKEVFAVFHPSRLRSKARPLLLVGDTTSRPTGWAWTGPDYYSDSIAAGLETLQSQIAQRGDLRLHVHAWQSVDNSGKSTFYVSRFRARNINAGSLRLSFRTGANSEEYLWSGVATGDWISIRKPIAATAGAITVFSVQNITASGEKRFADQNFTWRMPALFEQHRRLTPGEQIAPAADSELCLITSAPPIVENAFSTQQGIPLSSTEVMLFRIRVCASEVSARIASLGSIWILRPKSQSVAQLRLVQSEGNSEDLPQLFISDPLVRVFSRKLPQVRIIVHTSNSESLSDEEAFSLLSHHELCLGVDDELSPDCVMPLRELRASISLSRTNESLRFTLPLEGVLPARLLEPSFAIQRVGLSCWLSEQNEDSMQSGAMFERFVTLPYDSEQILPRTRMHCGSLLLRDSSKTYDDLVLYAFDSESIPVAGDFNSVLTDFEAHYPFTDLKIRARRELPTVGVWFFNTILALDEFIKLFRDAAPSCGVCQVPEGHSIFINVFGGRELLISSKSIAGPYSEDIFLANLVCDELKSDANAQTAWLSHSRSRLTVTYNQGLVESLEIDLRLAVVGFELLEIGPTTVVGSCTIRTLVSAIPGFAIEKTLNFELIDLAQSEVVVEQFSATWITNSLKVERKTIEFKAPHPGEYELRLKRPDDDVVLKQLKATVSSTSDDVIDIDTYLTEFPHGPLSLSVLHQLYYLTLRTHAPWKVERLKLKLNNARDSIDSTTPEYRLLDTLLAFLTDKKLPSVEIVRPRDVSNRFILEVALVTLQVQFASQEASRSDLKLWQQSLERAAEQERDDSRKSLLLALHCVANSLLPASQQTTQKTKAIYQYDCRYACKEDFLQTLLRAIANSSTKE